jgi:adhesin HecA-like repeat protein
MDRTWTDAQGGAWTTTSDWSPEGVPGSTDTALITTPGTYAILVGQSESVGSLVLDDAGATVLVGELSAASPTTFAVDGGIALDSGRLDIVGSDRTGLGIAGAVYTLDNASTLEVSGGIAGRPGGASGTLFASVATIDLIGSQTLDSVTLVMGSSVELLASGGTATFGSGFVLEQTGSLDGLDGTLVNQGLIEFSGAPWVQIGGNAPSSFTNSGTIVAGREEVLATLQDFANAGLLDIIGAFDLNIGRSFANTGTVALAAGGTFDLNARTSLAALGRIDNAGGTIGIGGTLDLGGGTLAVAAGETFGNVLLTGTVRDGTIAPAGGTLVAQGGTFDGITYDGVLDLSTLGAQTTLDVVNGLSVQAGTVDITGPGDTLEILDSETLAHLTLDLGAADGGDSALLGEPAGTLTLGPNAVLNGAGGQMTISAGAFVNEGSIGVAGGALAIGATSLTNAGTLDLAGSGTTVTLDAESLANSGRIDIGAGSRLVLQTVTFQDEPPPAGFTNTGTVTMVPGSELVLDTNTSLAGLGTIAGSGGTLDIAPKQNWFSSETGGVLDLGGGTLVVGGSSAISELIIQGTIEDGSIVLLPGGTLVPLTSGIERDVQQQAPCYLAGTRIRTPCGEVAVEELAVGGEVVTASGEAKPIAWIGQRRIDCRRHRQPELIWPVRVRAGAFGPDQPARDLLLSPDHAVSVPAARGDTDVLIPIKHLINGLSIAQEKADSVHYFHIELAKHDVILAEGLPAETYLDTGNRAMFANGGAALALHPDFFPRGWNEACAPLCQSGPDLAAARRRLSERARSLGWSAPGLALVHILADERDFPPAAVRGRLHRFLLPAGTRARIVPRQASAGVAQPVRLGGVLLNGRVLDIAAVVPAASQADEPGMWRIAGTVELRLPPAPGPRVLELLLEQEPGKQEECRLPSELAA